MRKQAVGEHIVEAFSDGRSSRVTELNIKDHPHGYTLDGVTGRQQPSVAVGCGRPPE